MVSITLSKPHKHRLRLPRHSPDIKNFFLDFVFEGENVFCRCAAAVPDGHRMFTRDSDWPKRIAFAESRLLPQPCRCEFYLALGCGVAWHRFSRNALLGKGLNAVGFGCAD